MHLELPCLNPSAVLQTSKLQTFLKFTLRLQVNRESEAAWSCSNSVPSCWWPMLLQKPLSCQIQLLVHLVFLPSFSFIVLLNFLQFNLESARFLEQEVQWIVTSPHSADHYYESAFDRKPSGSVLLSGGGSAQGAPLANLFSWAGDSRFSLPRCCPSKLCVQGEWVSMLTIRSYCPGSTSSPSLDPDRWVFWIPAITGNAGNYT